jgi:hypothetical protein
VELERDELGKPMISAMIPADGLDPKEVLSLAAEYWEEQEEYVENVMDSKDRMAFLDSLGIDWLFEAAVRFEAIRWNRLVGKDIETYADTIEKGIEHLKAMTVWPKNISFDAARTNPDVFVKLNEIQKVMLHLVNLIHWNQVQHRDMNEKKALLWAHQCAHGFICSTVTGEEFEQDDEGNES